MDILSQYYDTLVVLKNLLDKELKKPFSLRCNDKVRILSDEIQDVEFAIRGMERNLDDKLGYRPRRATLVSRADLYVAMSKEI